MTNQASDAPKRLGQFLRSFRERKGLTLKQVAEHAGLHVPYLSQVENGQKGIPTLKTFSRLATAFGLPSSEFVALVEKSIRTDSSKSDEFEPVGERLKKWITEYQKLSPQDQEDVLRYARQRRLHPIAPVRKYKSQ